MNLIPKPYLMIAKVAALVAVVAGLWAANEHFIVNPAVSAETARWQARWDARDKADAAASLAQEKKNREKERELQAAADAEQRKAEAQQEDLSRRLAASNAAAQQLQVGIGKAIEQLGGTTPATSSRAAAARTGLLLAELYRSIDERAGDLAAEADRRREAGLTCERLYNKAR